jgi:hypothetical protein
MLRERTEILEECMQRNNAELSVCRQEVVAKNSTIAQLQQRARNMTQHMMTVTDHKFEVKVSGILNRKKTFVN